MDIMDIDDFRNTKELVDRAYQEAGSFDDMQRRKAEYMGKHGLKRYIVQHHYESHVGRYKTGQILELDDELAAWMNRDSKGVLVEIIDGPSAVVKEPELEARVIEAPPEDRMVRKAEHKRR